MPGGRHFWAGQKPGEQKVYLLGKETSMRGKATLPSQETCRGPRVRPYEMPTPTSVSNGARSQPGASQSPLGRLRQPGHFPTSPDFPSLPTAGTRSDKTDLGFIRTDVRMRSSWAVYTCSQAWRNSNSGDRARRRCDQKKASATSLGLGTKAMRGGQGRAEAEKWVPAGA